MFPALHAACVVVQKHRVAVTVPRRHVRPTNLRVAIRRSFCAPPILTPHVASSAAVRDMSSSARHHYRSAPAHLVLVSAATAADAFLTAFPRHQLACAGIQQKQQHHSYAAAPTATGRSLDYLPAESDGDGGAVGEEDGEELRDCVIVGAGISGLAAAADLERAGLDFVLLEAGELVNVVGQAQATSYDGRVSPFRPALAQLTKSVS